MKMNVAINLFTLVDIQEEELLARLKPRDPKDKDFVF
jgi:hypothetical protein